MASQTMMVDSYIGGIGHVSFVPGSTTNFESNSKKSSKKVKPKAAFEESDETVWKNERVLSPSNLSSVFNQTDEDKIIMMTCTDEAKTKTTNINMTEEYNVGYTGLSILPWENFVLNPQILNELFYAETTQKITYDPEEVNIFFHGKNVMPPIIGDISENGKSWNINVNGMAELREVRTYLTERCSVFGVTLLYKEKKFSKPERAPCLVMLDPSKGNIGDRLYTELTRALDCLYSQRRFCVEVNLNGCVERWCRRVLLTECKAVGAKLIITNGEEYEQLDRAEDVVCCVACFPIWLIQTGIYKLHRMVVYDDYFVKFDTEDLFLHGAFQDPTCQRHKIFTAVDDEVFRIRNIAQTDRETLDDLGIHKFLCVKKYNKSACLLNEEGHVTMQEYKTVAFNKIVEKRRDKVLRKEKKSSDKAKEIMEELGSGRKVRFDMDQTECKVPLDNGSLDSGHDNNVFKSSDDEMENWKALPELTSSYDLVDSKLSGEVDFTSSTGALFSRQSDQTSPRLKPKQSCLAEIRENGYDNTSYLTPFQDSEISHYEESSAEEENDKNEERSRNDFVGEMKKIDQSLPSSELSREYRAKNIEELKKEEQTFDVNQKKFKREKSNHKPKMTHALKDLMKTTNESASGLPSLHDVKFIKAKNNLAQSKQSSCPEADATKTNQINKDEEMKTVQEESSFSGYEANIAKECLTKEERTNVKPFAMDESSSDGDDVEMIYQSEKVKEQEFDIYKSNNAEETSKEETDTGINPKPILKKSKEEKSRSILPKLLKQPNNDELQSCKTLTQNKTFKMPDDIRLEDGDDLWSNLRSSQIIPVGVTDKTKSVDTTYLDQNPVERDIEITDWELDDNERSDPKPTEYKNTHSPQTKSIAENLAARKKKRGVNRFDSSRKYLGASIPHKTKKTEK